LLKPFPKIRLHQAVDKVVERFRHKIKEDETVKKLVNSLHEQQDTLERIVVKNGNQIHVISIEDIIQLEAQDDYVMIHTPEGRFMKKDTMSYMEQHLPAEQFIRIHRSNIVQIKHIKKMEQYGKESYVIILSNGNQVNVSKSRIKDLKRELNF
ncbi:MAG TPA: LytTR family DNA-binding domain-containing protein, partial [Bacteroidales bacterium]|nr:LytTR family DNA-binding domain-containing protein [Bacteroidales bacterium]